MHGPPCIFWANLTPFSLQDEKTGKNAQGVAFVEWFMANIRQQLQDKSEAEEPEPATGGQVEVTYLLGALLFDEIFALIIGDMLLAVIR